MSTRKLVNAGEDNKGRMWRKEMVLDSGGNIMYYVSDYSKGDVIVRVIEHRGRCSIGRENAEVFQVKPVAGRTRTFKHVDRAYAKAWEMLDELA